MSRQDYNEMYPNGTAGYGNGYGGGNSAGYAAQGDNDPSNNNNFNWGGLTSGLGEMAGGIFGNSGSPFSAASNAYNQYAQQGAAAEQPYQQAGENAIGNYQKWAQSMSNPTQFNNQLMSQYQESPYAKFMQQQAIRSAQNAGSAEGMVGSSPYNLQVEQNASNISGQDMNNWMQNVLGLNTQYGNAEQNMMNTGANAANSLVNLYGNEANAQGEAAAGEAAGQNKDENNGIGGAISTIANIFGG